MPRFSSLSFLSPRSQPGPRPWFLFAGVGSSLPAKAAGAPVHTGTIVGIVLAVLLIAAIILAGIYINSHPTSNAALFFIEVSREPFPSPFSLPLPSAPMLPFQRRAMSSEERGSVIDLTSKFLSVPLQPEPISQFPADDAPNLGSLPPPVLYFALFHPLPFTPCLLSPYTVRRFHLPPRAVVHGGGSLNGACGL